MNTEKAFQARVVDWMLACFTPQICRDKGERNHRFLEESLELVQSKGLTREEAHMLVDYTYGRPVGDPTQEVGGVMVTLAALCAASDMDMHGCAVTEIERCWLNIEKIRAKQKSKPSSSPLPAPMQVEPALRYNPVLSRAGAPGWIAEMEQSPTGEWIHVSAVPNGEDAANWRALRHCSRITTLGSAGIHPESSTYEAPEAHLTLNFWTHSRGGDQQDIDGRRDMDTFVRKLRKL